jgi:copper chaperone NosL
MQKILIVVVALLFVGCIREEVAKPLPIELTREHACQVCGMITVDLPGPKAQIHYKNGNIDTFCGIMHMFSFYLQPDRPPNIASIYVNDMGESGREHPENHWIDAINAFYVNGGDAVGPHGGAIIPFSDIKYADAYVKEHGGRIVKFDDVTMDMLKFNAHFSHS